MLAPDIEDFLVNYLTPLEPPGQVSFEMPTKPKMPFILVNRLDGGDNEVTEEATVSVHVFHTTRSLAAYEARRMHQQMKSLLPRTAVLMSDGSYASVDYVETVETPAWREYEDKTIWRYCGRYKIDLRLSSMQAP